MLNIGDRIRHRSNTQLKGIVRDVLSNSSIEIVWDNGDIDFLAENEIELFVLDSTPWERLVQNRFDNFGNYTIATIVDKVRNTSANTISTLKASKTIFKPYQFIPLLKLLHSDKKRIIIADEVGLGKTISAGHIALELAARGSLKSLLVICLNSIQEKWIDELLNKFNIRLTRFQKLRDFKDGIENFKNNGDPIYGVINFDKFKNKNDLEYFQQNSIVFDLIIVDEAHTLRNETNCRRAIKPFTEIANALVLLTATPIMTSLENLYNLVKLLDTQNFSNFQIFQNSVNVNKPIIQAFNQLNSGVHPKEIAKYLIHAKIENVFKYGDTVIRKEESLSKVLADDELYQRLIHELKESHTLNLERRVMLQELMINLNSLNHFYSRTRKKEVLTQENAVTRSATVVEIKMTEEEDEIYHGVMSQYGNELGVVQLKRKYSSSLFADRFSEEQYDKNINLNLSKLNDSKYSALHEIIRQQEGNQLIVFSTFRKTLLYLKNRLCYDGFQVNVILGGKDLTERNDIIEKFRNSEFQILLSSEVGSTGLDMQFCSRIVNYDLPWNPMVIEQRIGRIDRIGQKSELINIFNFVYAGTIEEQIYKRLYERIGLFQDSLGNLDEILGEKEMYIEGEIEKLYKKQLSTEEKRKRLDEIAEAVENNKIISKKIEEGLKDSFSNDLYFENAIKSIEKNNQYLTENDLLEIVNRLIVNKLSTMTIVEKSGNEKIYEIQQPSPNLIFSFIEEYYDKNDSEQRKIFKDFKTKHYSKNIYCTFNQQFAFENKNIEYISAYHPLIQSAANFFGSTRLDRNSVFRFGLDMNKIPLDLLTKFNRGYYFLVRFNYEITKQINGKESRLDYLRSLVIDMNGEDFEVMNKEYSEAFASICDQFVSPIPDHGSINFNDDLVDELKHFYSDESIKMRNDFEKTEKLKFDSELQRRTAQELLDLEKQIENRQIYIVEGKGIESILKSEIVELENRRDLLLDSTKNSRFSVKSRLISLNFVFVYD